MNGPGWINTEIAWLPLAFTPCESSAFLEECNMNREVQVTRGQTFQFATAVLLRFEFFFSPLVIFGERWICIENGALTDQTWVHFSRRKIEGKKNAGPHLIKRVGLVLEDKLTNRKLWHSTAFYYLCTHKSKNVFLCLSVLTFLSLKKFQQDLIPFFLELLILN